jgi:hypothetical protein
MGDPAPKLPPDLPVHGREAIEQDLGSLDFLAAENRLRAHSRFDLQAGPVATRQTLTAAWVKPKCGAL